MAVQVFAAALEFFARESNPYKIDTHGELLILGLNLVVTGPLLGQRLVVHGKREYDVGADFSGVELAIESAQLYGVVAVEEAMQIQHIMFSYT